MRLGFRSGDAGSLSAAEAGDCRPQGGPRGPTWRVERGQLSGSGVLRAPAPAIRCFVFVELRLLAGLFLGARHGQSPGPPGALCWQRRLRRQGRGTAARSRRPMTAQRRGWWRRRRGPRPAARHSQSRPAPGPFKPISGRRAAANRGAPGAGPQLGAAGRGSAGRRRVPSPLRPRPGPRRHPQGSAGCGASHLRFGLPSSAMARDRAPPDPQTGISSTRTIKCLLCGRNASDGAGPGRGTSA